MTKELPDIILEPGQTVVVVGAAPVTYNRDKKTQTRVRVTDPRPYVEAPPPPPPPPPPTTTGTVFGPGIASDGKDNVGVGIDPSFTGGNAHYAAFWHTDIGGTITSVGFNQRTDTSKPGYSHGDGGKYDITLHQGSPTGPVLGAVRGYKSPPPSGSDTEHRPLIPFSATIPPGDYFLVWDNVHADPTNNWQSINNLVHPSGNQPGTGTQTWWKSHGGAPYGTSDKWVRRANNTPNFQVTFADGHVEGQGYGSIIANTNIDGDGGGSGFALSGSRRLRQRLTAAAPLNVKAAVLRAKRLSGTGNLSVTINGVTAIGDVSSIPATTKTDLNGGVWIRVPLTTTVPIGPFTVAFASTPVLDVMPIRKDGQEQDGWKVPGTPGYAEKSFDGGATWAPVYNTGTDLQMYLELAPATVAPRGGKVF